MNRAPAITAAIACALASLGSSTAWAADPVSPADAQATAKDDAGPEKPAEVLKTKTRSNQSNDRAAAPPAEDQAATEESAAVVKTKTKSNQSND
jgi:hypothetical protein